MNEESKPINPIFIVAASRSGTRLIQVCLNMHPDISITGETHFFEDLRPRTIKKNEPLTDEDKDICEKYFLALSHRPYGHKGDPSKGRLNLERFRNLTKESGGGVDAYFQAYCMLSAEEKGRTRWGEKTPRHVYRIDDILKVYPKAKVICMVRDPRGMIASYRDWKYRGGFDFKKNPDRKITVEEDYARASKSYNLIIHSFLWRGSVIASMKARKKYGSESVYILKFEDILINSEKVIRDLCKWLDVDYDPNMLHVPMTNSSFDQFNETGGFSTAPVERWKKKLTKREIAVIQQICSRYMKKFEYKVEPFMAPLYMTYEWLKLPLAVLRAINANRSRIYNLPNYIIKRIMP